MDQDNEHLNLLSIFYYIIGGLNILGSLGLFGLAGFISFMPKSMLQNTQSPSGPPPEMFMGFIGVMYGIMGLFALAQGICNIIAAPKFKRCEGKIFCMVIAGINCLNVPLGTALGIFTFVVLARPSVVARFEPKVF
jgi:hypothetical protein